MSETPSYVYNHRVLSVIPSGDDNSAGETRKRSWSAKSASRYTSKYSSAQQAYSSPSRSQSQSPEREPVDPNAVSNPNPEQSLESDTVVIHDTQSPVPPVAEASSPSAPRRVKSLPPTPPARHVSTVESDSASTDGPDSRRMTVIVKEPVVQKKFEVVVVPAIVLKPCTSKGCLKVRNDTSESESFERAKRVHFWRDDDGETTTSVKTTPVVRNIDGIGVTNDDLLEQGGDIVDLSDPTHVQYVPPSPPIPEVNRERAVYVDYRIDRYWLYKRNDGTVCGYYDPQLSDSDIEDDDEDDGGDDDGDGDDVILYDEDDVIIREDVDPTSPPRASSSSSANVVVISKVSAKSGAVGTATLPAPVSRSEPTPGSPVRPMVPSRTPSLPVPLQQLIGYSGTDVYDEQTLKKRIKEAEKRIKEERLLLIKVKKQQEKEEKRVRSESQRVAREKTREEEKNRREIADKMKAEEKQRQQRLKKLEAMAKKIKKEEERKLKELERSKKRKIEEQAPLSMRRRVAESRGKPAPADWSATPLPDTFRHVVSGSGVLEEGGTMGDLLMMLHVASHADQISAARQRYGSRTAKYDSATLPARIGTQVHRAAPVPPPKKSQPVSDVKPIEHRDNETTPVVVDKPSEFNDKSVDVPQSEPTTTRAEAIKPAESEPEQIKNTTSLLVETDENKPPVATERQPEPLPAAVITDMSSTVVTPTTPNYDADVERDDKQDSQGMSILELQPIENYDDDDDDEHDDDEHDDDGGGVAYSLPVSHTLQDQQAPVDSPVIVNDYF